MPADLPPTDSPPFRFGRFRLEPARRALLVDGEPARLGARAIDVLVALVQRRDRVVGKNELFDLVWPGLVVEENNLQVHVSALRKLLGAQTIATIPGRGYQFVARLDDEGEPRRGGAPADVAHGVPTAAASRTNLPAHLPALIGRADEIEAVAALVRDNAVVTLAGAAGIGKTALALAVAQLAVDAYPGGVWWVELAALTDPKQVAPLVGRTLGVVGEDGRPSSAAVATALRAQRRLLVLDNCEHVLDAAAALVEALRRAAPQVHVLATSQENLKVAGEQVFRLSPLAVAEGDFDTAAHSGAVELFVARAQAADRGFVLTRENLGAVVEICRRLDGLPLAIELAAARLPLLGVDGVRARLNERFRVLTGGARLAARRHQTLRAAFEWSHDLLTDPEQTVFRRLGVFVGGFSLELAQRVACDERIDGWAVLDHLGVLVDKSLVIAEGRSAPRYRLLETGRAFALEKLEQAGETDEWLRRHALALREALAGFDDAVAREPRFDHLVHRFEPEVDNLRAALAWACGTGGDRETAIALVACSDWLYNELDLLREGWTWCQAVLPWVDASTPLPLAARFRLTAAGLGRVSMRPAHEWVGWARQAAADSRTLGDAVGLYRALCLLGAQTDRIVPHDEAGAYLDEAARIEDPAWSPRLRLRRQSALEWWFDVGGQMEQSRQAGQRHVVLAREAGGVAEVGALSNLADTEYTLGRSDVAIELIRAAIARAAELGRPSAASHAHGNIVPALLDRDDLAGAAEAIRAGRESFVRSLGTAFSLLPYLPALVARRGDHRLAARLIGCADREYGGSGRTMHPPERRARDRLLDELRAALSEDELQALLREGAAWSEDEAFERALADAANAGTKDAR
jgi:predicted ATPase/DNA-binding winged helix-turn-helix (wHTH) protein